MEKGFNILISEPKVYEIITRTIYIPRKPILSIMLFMKIKKKIMIIILGNLILLFKIKEMLNKKSISTDNSFLTLDETLRISNNGFNED